MAKRSTLRICSAFCIKTGDFPTNVLRYIPKTPSITIKIASIRIKIRVRTFLTPMPEISGKPQLNITGSHTG